MPNPQESELYRAICAQDIHRVSAALDAGADVNEVAYGQPLLHIAVIFGNIDIVARLLEHDADVQAVDRALRTVAHVAAITGESAAFFLLVAHGMSVNGRDWQGYTPIDEAYGARDERIFRWLLAQGHRPRRMFGRRSPREFFDLVGNREVADLMANDH